MLVSDMGMGKSNICKQFLNKVSRDTHFKITMQFNSQTTSSDILEAINHKEITSRVK